MQAHQVEKMADIYMRSYPAVITPLMPLNSCELHCLVTDRAFFIVLAHVWILCLIFLLIGRVNEYPTMHYFGIPRHTQQMMAYKISIEYFWKFQ